MIKTLVSMTVCFTLLALSSTAGATYLWTNSTSGYAAGYDAVVTGGSGWLADYGVDSATQSGNLIGNYNGSWGSDDNTLSWIATYSDMNDYPWGVVTNSTCGAGSGYVYYGVPDGDSFTISELSDVNSVCVQAVVAGNPCLTNDASGCTNLDIWAVGNSGQTIYRYEDGGSGWGFYSANSTIGFNDPGTTAVTSIALFSHSGYENDWHDLWIATGTTNSTLTYFTTVHSEFGYEWQRNSSVVLSHDCDTYNMVLTQDFVLCQTFAVYEYSGSSWSLFADDCEYDYGAASIGYSSGSEVLYCYSQGEGFEPSTATIQYYAF
jgi:hypothetical protein